MDPSPASSISGHSRGSKASFFKERGLPPPAGTPPRDFRATANGELRNGGHFQTLGGPLEFPDPDIPEPTVRLGGERILNRRPSGNGNRLPAISPPPTPPDSEKSTARLNKTDSLSTPKSFRSFGSGSQLETPKVKWIPHSHANPKHAKFCYMCLHGALEGKDEEEVDLEDDIPTELEMKNRGYLYPDRFRRYGADFTNNNLLASWFREQLKVQYKINTRELAKLNKQIILESHGSGYGSSYLYVEQEENEDWRILRKCFELTEEEMMEMERMQDEVERYCSAIPLEAALGKTKEPSKELPALEYEVPKHIEILEYEPPLDDTKMSQDAKDCIAAANAWSKTEGSIFDRHSFPFPSHKPFCGDFKLLYNPLAEEDIPEYPVYKPPRPPKPMVVDIGDPFPKPFFYIHEFKQETIPTFQVSAGGNHPLGPCYFEEFPCLWRLLHPKIKGVINFPMPPLLDHPYLPPVEILSDGAGSRKKIIQMKSLWEPEIVSSSGRCLPPIAERVKAMHFDLDFEKKQSQRRADTWVELSGAAEIAQELIPIIQVKAMARFLPKKMQVETPEFLLNCIWADFIGQDPMKVINQRHEVVLKEKERVEKDRRLRQLEDEKLRKMQEQEELEAEALDEQWIKDPVPVDGDTMLPSEMVPLPLPEGAEDVVISSPAPALLPPQPQQQTIIDGSEQKPAVVAAPETQGEKSEVLGSEAKPEKKQEEEETPKPTAVPEATTKGETLEKQEEERKQQRHTIGAVPEPKPQTQQGEEKKDDPPSLANAEKVGVSLPPHSMATQSTALPGTTLDTNVTVSARLAQTLQDALPSDIQNTDLRQALSAHHERLQSLLDEQKRDAQIEHILSQDTFVDRLAAKLSEKLDIQQKTQSRADGGGKGPWKPKFDPSQIPQGDLSQHTTLTGQRMSNLADPWPLTFVDDTTVSNKYGGLLSLPAALQGDDPTEGAPMIDKKADLKLYTMEKARGDCYVRLVTEIEPLGSTKDIDPYAPQLLEPDNKLILQQRFCLTDEQITKEEAEAFEDIEQSNVILFSFVRHDRFEAVQQLLEESNELIKEKDANGNTLLHIACQNNHRRIAKFLLRMGVDINAQNKNGNTALHYSYAFKFAQLSEVLIQYGADSVATNNEGLVPSQGLGKAESEERQSLH